MSGRVTIGVPVYHGEAYLAETLICIQQQTYSDFEVIMSVDGTDPVCEEICQQYLSDARFRLVVQTRRRGWIGNINWLMSQADGDFWYFHQQDDLTHPTYLEVLVNEALAHPSAALVYCDLIPFGRIQEPFKPVESVLGANPFSRQMAILHHHFPAFAFRGLTRSTAMKQAGDIPENEFGGFGCDIAWLAGVALAGELVRVPQSLYRKRYHDRNTESEFWSWPREKRLHIWAAHCVTMLEQALRVDASVQEYRLLWLAAVDRLTSPSAAGHYLPVVELTHQERAQLLGEFIERSKSSSRHDIPQLLDASWRDIVQLAERLIWLPTERLEIAAHGPDPVAAGQGFNEQPDGSSAIWIRTSRAAPPDTTVNLAGVILQSTVRGTLITAKVPPELTARPGEVEIHLVSSDGKRRSRPTKLKIVTPSGAG